MKIGVTVRNMGPQSDASTFRTCAEAADKAGFESLWITDHIAIPPDDAEGSGGRYLDPLVSLGVLAGATKHIMLGTGVLILPYRPALPTAKQVATLQELSGERLLLGVGIGWMDPEFKALGLNRHRRGQMSDSILEFMNRCFTQDVVEENGQAFLFKPRPTKPPFLIGGRAPHALLRAATYGDGWLPMSNDPGAIAAQIQTYWKLCEEQERPAGSVSVMTGLPTDDADLARQRVNEYAEAGVERLICSVRYDTTNEYVDQIGRLAQMLPIFAP
jgi:probable F420-dependent oxidoreductase